MDSYIIVGGLFGLVVLAESLFTLTGKKAAELCVRG